MIGVGQEVKVGERIDEDELNVISDSLGWSLKNSDNLGIFNNHYTLE